MKETLIIIGLVVLVIVACVDVGVSAIEKRDIFREGYRKGKHDERERWYKRESKKTEIDVIRFNDTRATKVEP